jgi:hypothetical protein
MTDQGGQSKGIGQVEMYRGSNQINQETEEGNSMEMDETGMEFPTMELTASRI